MGLRGGLALLSLVVACRSGRAPASNDPPMTLERARRNFRTHVSVPERNRSTPPSPPEGTFSLVRYRSRVGELSAYVTPRPRQGGRRPALVWLHGGFSNSIGETWHAAPTDNDQTAAAFRAAGVVLMLPSLRGGNDNPGTNEGFLGEVDDVVAAAEHLAALDYVDPTRVYLAGHSTGGTLALLVAERTDRFRAVFSFGPLGDVRDYGEESLPLGSDDQEAIVRSPVHFLRTIRTPTWVIEGEQGNAAVFPSLRAAAGNAPVRFEVLAGATHFNGLQPVSALLARKILDDRAPNPPIALDAAELAGALVPYGPYDGHRASGAPGPPGFASVVVLDPRGVFDRTADRATLDPWIRSVEAARRHLTAGPDSYGVRLRVTLRPDDAGDVQVQLTEGAPQPAVLAFFTAFGALERPRTRHDPLRLEITLVSDDAP